MFKTHKFYYFILLLILVALLFFINKFYFKDNPGPIDKKATPETKALFFKLLKVGKDKILFGHQDSTYFGVGWKNPDKLQSDVKNACGKLPAVYGWDILQLKWHMDDIARGLREAHERGGINTVSWHMWNPVTGENFYDITPAVAAILPGGKKHEALKKELDSFAEWVKKLKDKKGKLIPLIFRPFHEHTGSWFWWGKYNCTEEEYKKLWRFTVEYLRDKKKLHNLLYAYSPAKSFDGLKEEYTWGYPGDDYIDILGYDHYCQDVSEALPSLRMVVELAEGKGKIPAFTETGVPDGMLHAEPGNYYTERLLKPLKEDGVASRISYIMLWRNKDKEHYWIPYPGHKLTSDLKKFSKDPIWVFEKDLINLKSFTPEDK